MIDAVLLVAFGGPTAPGEIRPFLEAADLAGLLTPEELSTPRDGERGNLGVA